MSQHGRVPRERGFDYITGQSYHVDGGLAMN
jgi:hypothetical protein